MRKLRALRPWATEIANLPWSDRREFCSRAISASWRLGEAKADWAQLKGESLGEPDGGCVCVLQARG